VPSVHEPEDSSGPPQGETTTGPVGGLATGLVGGGGAAGDGGAYGGSSTVCVSNEV
jgi:hypothetical protein